MASTEEFLCQGGEEKFKEAVNLSDVECRNDTESDPYKSKYKAREIFHELKLEADKYRNDGPFSLDWSTLVAVLDLRLGINYVECEELSTGEEHLDKCVSALEEYRLDAKCCSTLHNALNQLGILWAGRRQPDRALEYLQRAESLYSDYKREVGSSPDISNELFRVKLKDEDAGAVVQRQTDHLEDTYTHTLYYLAQVYGKMEEEQKSAEYCQETLRRQLDTKKYVALDWALNAATLSQFYVITGNFPQARHSLASACLILQELGDPPKCLTVEYNSEESQDDLTERERLPKAWSDVYRCWIKYGLALLEYSQSRLYEELGPDSENKPEVAANNEESKEMVHEFNLEVTAIEAQITAKPLLVFEEARQVFLTAQKWLNSAKEFYVIDGHCTDHVEIIQDHSKLYKFLAFFERDFDRQCKMHKRRIDILQGVVDQLSMQYYLLICRQLLYELAETYSTMLDIKLAIIEDSDTRPTVHARNKINLLTSKSIEQFHLYVDSLRDTAKILPSKYSDEDERPALVAHFCIGRLYSKFLEFDAAKQIANVEKSIENYRYVVDYCKQNPESEAKVKSENEICAEMVALLPTKIARIRAAAVQ